MEEGRENTRRDVIATLAILALFVALLGGRAVWRKLARHPSAERCAAMLDRYAEQQNRAYERVPSRVDAPRPLGAPDVVRCMRELTDDEVECALEAGYADELERCLPP
jgi:hypothetical protein